MKKSIVKDLSFELSVDGINVFTQMKRQKEFVLSKQFLRSITSIGANVQEAYEAESKKDFIHKLSVSLKEAKESAYWIRLMENTDLVTLDTLEIKKKLNSVTALLISIIKTAKKNAKVTTKTAKRMDHGRGGTRTGRCGPKESIKMEKRFPINFGTAKVNLLLHGKKLLQNNP